MAAASALATAPACSVGPQQACGPCRPGRLTAAAPQARPFSAARQRLLSGGQRPAHHPPLSGASEPPAVVAQLMNEAEPQLLVEEVLQTIEGTDSGDNMDAATRAKVAAALQRLKEIGAAEPLRPLDNPLIWGNYSVPYVAPGPTQYGQPAGGRFRGSLGKLLFRTTFVGQSVLQPDVVTNKVAFMLLGLIPGSVGLRGKLVPIPDQPGGQDQKDLVKVFFEPPVLSLGNDIHVRIGPPSTVVLKTTYLDERVRLGEGSRGSLFVFTRGGAADSQGMDQVGLQQCSPLGKMLLWGVVAALMVNGGLLAARAGLPPVIRAAGVVQVLLGTALGGVVYRGGIIQDEGSDDRPEVGRPQEA